MDFMKSLSIAASGMRAQAGRMPEKGWPRARRFKD